MCWHSFSLARVTDQTTGRGKEEKHGSRSNIAGGDIYSVLWLLLRSLCLWSLLDSRWWWLLSPLRLRLCERCSPSLSRSLSLLWLRSLFLLFSSPPLLCFLSLLRLRLDRLAFLSSLCLSLSSLCLLSSVSPLFFLSLDFSLSAPLSLWCSLSFLLLLSSPPSLSLSLRSLFRSRLALRLFLRSRRSWFLSALRDRRLSLSPRSPLSLSLSPRSPLSLSFLCRSRSLSSSRSKLGPWRSFSRWWLLLLDRLGDLRGLGVRLGVLVRKILLAHAWAMDWYYTVMVIQDYTSS